MTQLLVLIGLFAKNSASSVPATLASMPIYLYFFVFCRQLYVQPTKLDDIVVNSKVLLWAFIILLDQLVMIGFSYVSTSQPDLTRGIFTGSVNTILFFANIFLIYYLMLVLIDSHERVLKFVQGTLVTYILFILLVLIPQVIATLSHVLDGWVNLIGGLFEARYVGRNDFYNLGSYVTTQHRVNGFSSEASYLAVLLAVIFIPFILAAIRYNFSYFKNKVDYSVTKYYWVLLLVSFMVLFFAKTTTGFVVILLAGLILLVRLNRERRQHLLLLALVAMVILLILYLNVTYIHDLLNNYLFKKQGTSNRLGGTIGLLVTFLHYPITGVGDGFTAAYNLAYVPIHTIHNWEFRHVYAISGYPILSVWGGWLAGYGLIGIIPVVLFVRHKCQQAVGIYKKLVILPDSESLLYQVLIESFFYALIMFFILALFMFSWISNIYFVVFFFYVVMLKFCAKNVVD